MIVIPLSRAGLAALTIITVSENWNNFFWPLVVVDRDFMRTLPLGLATFQGEYYTEYGQFFAVALIVIVPMVAAFIKVTGFMDRDSFKEKIRTSLSKKLRPEVVEMNLRTVDRAYEEAKEG